MRNGVDIIIPIYNAYDDLTLCLESIEKYTDLTLDRLILINDKSPDERILPLIESKKSENVIIIDNEQNLGFSNNVNNGMNCSKDRDVILLNSDTIVTKKWVDKIYECAYSANEIGTVTPLSNAATLCSIPLMCQDNKLPEGLTPDDMNEIVERSSVKAYPRITVAVGFCMFIKRECITATGLFDAKTFERGYGEENDFCNRAEQLGYMHVMCDDTFIYHKGTVSFMTEQKQKLIEAHDKILQERYPAQMKMNHLYCVFNPDQWIRDNVITFIDLKNKKQNILYLVHRDFREDCFDHIGGTQFHVRDLTIGLKDKYNVFVISRDYDYLQLTVYVDEKMHSYRFFIGNPALHFQFRNRDLYGIFGAILDQFEIGMVHIHHVESLSLDLYYAASERNIPLISTMHDFFAISPLFKLLDNKCNYIEPTAEVSAWKESLNQIGYYDADNLLKCWRKNFGNALSLCDTILFPSYNAKDIFLKVYPSLKSKVSVIEHGIEINVDECISIDKSKINIVSNINLNLESIEVNESIASITGWGFVTGMNSADSEIFYGKYISDHYELKKCVKTKRYDVADSFNSPDYQDSGFSLKIIKDENAADSIIIFKNNGKYYAKSGDIVSINWDSKVNDKKRIAFIGGICPEKGSDFIHDIMSKKMGTAYEWYLLGNCGDEKIISLKNSNLHMMGGYKVDELPILLSCLKIDLVVLLSPWPETYCYTLSEAIFCKVPVLGIDIGAVGDRINKCGYGWTVDFPASAKDIINKIDFIFNDRVEYDKVKSIASSFVVKSLKEMTNDYEILYKSVLGTKAINYKEKNSSLILRGIIGNAEHAGSFINYNSYVELKKLMQFGIEPTNLAPRKDISKNTDLSLVNEVAMYKSKYENIKNSKSWKITAPLRRITTIIRSLMS